MMSRLRQPEHAIALVPRYILVLVVAAVVGCAPAPTPTTPKAAPLYQVSREEQALDVVRSVTTTPPDRVHNSLFTCVGGSYATICDGSQKVLSWDNIPWINRQILQP